MLRAPGILARLCRVSRRCAPLAPAALALALTTGATLADETTPPIAHLQFRDRTVTLSASDAGPRFTVRDRDGYLRGSELTLEELIAREPEVGRLVESALAGGSLSSAGGLPWAGDGPDAHDLLERGARSPAGPGL